jgi:integrase/recombinase XerD
MDAITGISDPIIRDFALALTAEGKRPKTVKIYTSAASWLMEAQELQDWSNVRKSHVRRHIAGILENRSHSYANNQYRALQQFFKFLEAEEDILNPMAGMKPPTVPEKLVPVIPADDWSRLIGTCASKRYVDLRDKAILEFFRSTGARRSEIANLRAMDIDLDQLAAIVTGKGSRMRIVRFDAATGLALSRYLRARKAHRYATAEMLWLGEDGPLNPDAFNLMFRRRSEKAGVKFNPHRFRHDFSHRYLLNGGQETDLMQQNGWTSSDMLRRYGASAAAERAREHYDRVMSKSR